MDATQLANNTNRIKLAAAQHQASIDDDDSVKQQDGAQAATSADGLFDLRLAAPRPQGPVTTPGGLLLDRSSLVRVLTQSLHSLGYSGAAASLERESGVELESSDIARLRAEVTRGKWEEARERVTRMQLAAKNQREIQRLLAEQQFLVLLSQAIPSTGGSAAAAAASSNGKEKEHKSNGYSHGSVSANRAPSPAGSMMRAVQFLQTDLVPLLSAAGSRSTPNPRLLHLASLFTCTFAGQLQSQYRGPCVLPPSTTDDSSSDATASSPFQPLFDRIAAFLPSDAFLMQDRQLLRLLEHAVHTQVRQCHFHHEDEQLVFNLQQRHECTISLPLAPLLTLTDHTDEVLHVSFSHPRGAGAGREEDRDVMRMATCSKDRSIRIFTIKAHATTGARRKHSIAESEESKDAQQQATNGRLHARHSANGLVHASNGTAAAASSSAAAASSASVSSSASPLEFVCTSILHAPTPSPPSAASDSSAANSSSGTYWLTRWSPDNEYLLACNGIEASVFRVDDGVCVLSVGAKAVDNLAAAAAASGGTTARTDAQRTSSGSSGVARPLSGDNARWTWEARAAYSPLILPPAAGPGQNSIALQHVSRLLSSPLIPSLSNVVGSARSSALAGGPSVSFDAISSSTSIDHDSLVGHAEALTSCAWCNDGRSFVTGSVDRRLILWSLTGEILDVWLGDMISDIEIVGTRMIVTTPQSKCILFQIRDGRIEESASFYETTGIGSVSLSSDARFALVSVMRPAEMHLWDLGGSSEAAADQEQPAAGDQEDLFRPPSSMPTLAHRYSGFRAGRYIVRSCFGGPAQQLLCSGSEDGLVYVWHRDTARLMTRLRGHAATVNAVAACQYQGRYLIASASDDHTVKVWQCEAKQLEQGN